MTSRSESQLVKAIRDFVQLHENKGDAYIIRNNTIRQQVIRSNGSRGFIVNGKKGSPDLILCVRGRFIGIECKVGRNRQSKDQQQAQRIIEQAGGRYWLVYDFESFHQLFTEALSGQEG